MGEVGHLEPPEKEVNCNELDESLFHLNGKPIKYQTAREQQIFQGFISFTGLIKITRKT